MLRLLLLSSLLLSACAEVPGEAVAGGGPVAAQVEVRFRPVVEVPPGARPEPPDVLADREGVVHRLGPAIGDLARFEDVRAELTDHGWVVTLTLSAEDSAEFADWTAGHIGERLAVVVDGELITAPTIQSAITGGEVQISGNFSEQDAEELAGAISG